tara:strand:+ start:13972 stop:14400 length:429 start_codon:yes stop_codon:yes gene_type:complete
VLHGPNLNLLGTREPDLYGGKNLDAINQDLMDICTKKDCSLLVFQSNSEHILIERIHAAKKESAKFIIFNPAAFTHTSIALRDALLAIDIPFIEVHLSNIYAREEFRKSSYFSDIAKGVICGFGSLGYELALNAALIELGHQ